MKKTAVFVSKLVKSLKKLTFLWPSKLPVGMSAFDKLTKSICLTYDIEDLNGARQAVATMILHLPPTKVRATRRYFAHSLKKSMSNQIAYAVIQDIQAESKRLKQPKDTSAMDTKKHDDDVIEVSAAAAATTTPQTSSSVQAKS